MRIFIILCFAIIKFSIYSEAQLLKVADIFSDHMVIQQGINAPVWGRASANENIKIDFAGTTTLAIADSTGKWMARMPLLTAGGPYKMNITGKQSSIIYNDVMIGEVWLASGQSNMSFRVSETINSKQAVADASYDGIREYHVPYRVSGWPLENLVNSNWKICTPKTVGNFSAVAYFFAKALYKEKHVAVGIINCSEGGTPAEAWTSADMLLTNPDFRPRMLKLKTAPEDWQMLDSLADIIHADYKKQIDTTHGGESLGVQQLNFDDSQWKKSAYPLNAEQLGIPGYRFIWARKIVEIPAAYKKQKLILNLGKIIHQDITYFNGVKIGAGNKPGERHYTIPANLVKTGKNSIAVRLLSEWGYGRIGNPGDTPTISSNLNKKISLKESWTYNPDIEKDLPVVKEYCLEPSSLFNGMLSPVIPYGLKGMIWYQGEGNSGQPEQYAALLQGLITDWRIRFGQGNIPFLVVQLPNYRPGGDNWVKMREIQKDATRYPNTAMAVTIDLGDPEDVHPLNKQPVGERLYLAARNIAYHQNGVYSGPLYDSIRIAGNELQLLFTETGSGLELKGEKPASAFQVAGTDNRFFLADKIRIEGNTLIISSGKVPEPKSVRYAWEGNPQATLYNKENLPASPFQSGQ